MRKRPAPELHHRQAALAPPLRARDLPARPRPSCCRTTGSPSGSRADGPPIGATPRERDTGRRGKARYRERPPASRQRRRRLGGGAARGAGARRRRRGMARRWDHGGRRDGRQHGGRARPRAPAGRPGAEPRNERHRVHGLHRSDSRPHRNGRRFRRRERPLPAAGLHHERDQGDRRGRPSARRGPGAVRRVGARGARRRGWPRARPPSRRRADAEPAGCDGRPDGPAHRRDTGPTRPGRRRGRGVQSARGGRCARPRHGATEACSSSAVPPAVPPTGASWPTSPDVPSGSRPRTSSSPPVRRSRRPQSTTDATSRRVAEAWGLGRGETVEPDSTVDAGAIRAGYADAVAGAPQ